MAFSKMMHVGSVMLPRWGIPPQPILAPRIFVVGALSTWCCMLCISCGCGGVAGTNYLPLIVPKQSSSSSDALDCNPLLLKFESQNETMSSFSMRSPFQYLELSQQLPPCLLLSCRSFLEGSPLESWHPSAPLISDGNRGLSSWTQHHLDWRAPPVEYAVLVWLILFSNNLNSSLNRAAPSNTLTSSAQDTISSTQDTSSLVDKVLVVTFNLQKCIPVTIMASQEFLRTSLMNCSGRPCSINIFHKNAGSFFVIIPTICSASGMFRIMMWVGVEISAWWAYEIIGWPSCIFI